MNNYAKIQELANNIRSLSDDEISELVGHLSCDYTATSNATMKRMDICYHYCKTDIIKMYPLATAILNNK